MMDKVRKLRFFVRAAGRGGGWPNLVAPKGRVINCIFENQTWLGPAHQFKQPCTCSNWGWRPRKSIRTLFCLILVCYTSLSILSLMNRTRVRVMESHEHSVSRTMIKTCPTIPLIGWKPSQAMFGHPSPAKDLLAVPRAQRVAERSQAGLKPSLSQAWRQLWGVTASAG